MPVKQNVVAPNTLNSFNYGPCQLVVYPAVYPRMAILNDQTVSGQTQWVWQYRKPTYPTSLHEITAFANIADTCSTDGTS